MSALVSQDGSEPVALAHRGGPFQAGYFCTRSPVSLLEAVEM